MKKLRLNVEQLRIESFSTAPVAGELGTVHGEQSKPTLVGASCPAQVCQTYDDTLCGLTHGC